VKAPEAMTRLTDRANGNPERVAHRIRNRIPHTAKMSRMHRIAPGDDLRDRRMSEVN
jgi:hypothetical protein